MIFIPQQMLYERTRFRSINRSFPFILPFILPFVPFVHSFVRSVCPSVRSFRLLWSVPLVSRFKVIKWAKADKNEWKRMKQLGKIKERVKSSSIRNRGKSSERGNGMIGEREQERERGVRQSEWWWMMMNDAVWVSDRRVIGEWYRVVMFFWVFRYEIERNRKVNETTEKQTKVSERKSKVIESDRKWSKTNDLYSILNTCSMKELDHFCSFARFRSLIDHFRWFFRSFFPFVLLFRSFSISLAYSILDFTRILDRLISLNFFIRFRFCPLSLTFAHFRSRDEQTKRTKGTNEGKNGTDEHTERTKE